MVNSCYTKSAICAAAAAPLADRLAQRKTQNHSSHEWPPPPRPPRNPSNLSSLESLQHSVKKRVSSVRPSANSYPSDGRPNRAYTEQ